MISSATNKVSIPQITPTRNSSHSVKELQNPRKTMSLIPTIFGGYRNSIWDSLNGVTSSGRDVAAFANTRIDWTETPEAHVFKADLPGLKKEKVEVEEGRILQIRGERSEEQEEKSEKWHRIEWSSGRFSRSFRLPENAKVEELKASMENGVLTVTVPKEEEKKNKPETKSIEISG